MIKKLKKKKKVTSIVQKYEVSNGCIGPVSYVDPCSYISRLCPLSQNCSVPSINATRMLPLNNGWSSEVGLMAPSLVARGHISTWSLAEHIASPSLLLALQV